MCVFDISYVLLFLSQGFVQFLIYLPILNLLHSCVMDQSVHKAYPVIYVLLYVLDVNINYGYLVLHLHVPNGRISIAGDLADGIQILYKVLVYMY